MVQRLPSYKALSYFGPGRSMFKARPKGLTSPLARRLQRKEKLGNLETSRLARAVGPPSPAVLGSGQKAPTQPPLSGSAAAKR